MKDDELPNGGWPFVELTDERVHWWTADQIMRGTFTGNYPADGGDWADEIQQLWKRDRDRMVALVNDINNRGVMHPIRVAEESLKGDTAKHHMRVVDGHHRVAACLALVLAVPVVFMDWTEPCSFHEGESRDPLQCSCEQSVI